LTKIASAPDSDVETEPDMNSEYRPTVQWKKYRLRCGAGNRLTARQCSGNDSGQHSRKMHSSQRAVWLCCEEGNETVSLMLMKRWWNDF